MDGKEIFEEAVEAYSRSGYIDIDGLEIIFRRLSVFKDDQFLKKTEYKIFNKFFKCLYCCVPVCIRKCLLACSCKCLRKDNIEEALQRFDDGKNLKTKETSITSLILDVAELSFESILNYSGLISDIVLISDLSQKTPDYGEPYHNDYLIALTFAVTSFVIGQVVSYATIMTIKV